MKSNDPPTLDSHPSEIVIPKEKAVFWMDDQGRWQNRHGRFTHKRIVDHFNRSIRRDKDGYFVTQILGDVREKVYFAYDDTPIFACQVISGDPIHLVLNTGESIALDPAQLIAEADQLYQKRGDERIKFSGRALLAMAPYLEESVNGFSIRIGDRTWPIPDQGHCP